METELLDVLEKERTLFELRLLEERVEVEEWRQKYEQMVEKLELDDKLALKGEEDDEELDEGRSRNAHFPAIERLLLEHIHLVPEKCVSDHVADIAGLAFASPLVFARLSKILFGSKSLFTSLRVCLASRCGLTARYVEPLAHVLRNPLVQGVDLSHNLLDDVSLLSLIDNMQLRRYTPQYVLLHGNMKLGKEAAVVPRLIHGLNQGTWGLTVSLNDFHPDANEVNEMAVRAAKKALRAEQHGAYKEM